MYNSRNIIVGLVIFVGLMTFPFWMNIGNTSAAPELSLDTPVINQLGATQCIESTEFMRNNHMEMLSDWKNSVVRDGNRIYTATDGKQYNMSLQNTCMSCHSNKAQFCDQCHDFVGIKPPNCWDCHVEPKGVN